MVVSSSGGAHASDIGGASNRARKTAAPTKAAAPVRPRHTVSPTHSDLTPGAESLSPARAAAIGTAEPPAPSTSNDVVATSDPAAPLSMSAAPEPSEQAPASGLAAVPAVVTALLSPFDSTDPDAPVDSPVTWVVAAAARREVGVQQSVEPEATAMTSTSLVTDESVPETSGLALMAAAESPGLVSDGLVATGDSPSAVAISGNRAYVTNSGAGTVSVIDLATKNVIATIPVGTAPSAVAVNPTAPAPTSPTAVPAPSR